MSNHITYRFLKIGEYIHIGDEILLNGQWHKITKEEFADQKIVSFFVTDLGPNIRRAHPEPISNIEESAKIIKIIFSNVRGEVLK